MTNPAIKPNPLEAAYSDALEMLGNAEQRLAAAKVREAALQADNAALAETNQHLFEITTRQSATIAQLTLQAETLTSALEDAYTSTAQASQYASAAALSQGLERVNTHEVTTMLVDSVARGNIQAEAAQTQTKLSEAAHAPITSNATSKPSLFAPRAAANATKDSPTAAEVNSAPTADVSKP